MSTLTAKARKSFTSAAINCILDQKYPETQEIWDEAVALMAALTGTNMGGGGDAILMGDPLELSLALAAKEELEAQLLKMFPTTEVRTMMLDQGSDLLLEI